MYIKSQQQHREFLQQMVSLKLWFTAKWKYENPQESIADIIGNRTLIRNYTSFNDSDLNADISAIEGSADWVGAVNCLSDLYHTMKPRGDYESYEKAAFKLLESSIEQRIERDLHLFNTAYNSDESRSGSCFFFVDEEDNSPESNYLSNHFGNGQRFMRCHQWNNRYPESYLAEPDIFRRCLINLIDDTESCGAIGIYGTGWMNLFPIFSRQFPPEWRRNAIGPIYDIRGNLGCWGQFICPDYSFQHKTADRYRRTHIIPYPSTLCFATATDFRNFFAQ